MKIIGILGATCSGKSSTAVELAKLIDGEIISMDSMQIYQGLDIGTAKITTEQMQGVVHHMLDVVEPTQRFSAYDYCVMCQEIATDIDSRGKQIIFCGGTGLYMTSFLYGLDQPANETTQIIRNEMQLLYQQQGKEALLQYLSTLDNAAVANIDTNNIKRVIRAIEIASQGNSITTNQKNRIAKYDNSLFVLDRDRSSLYQDINNRVELMFESGLVAEVSRIYQQCDQDSSLQSLSAIGYKEVIPYINGEVSLRECKDSIAINSRHYAKRQISYLKRLDAQHIIADNRSARDIALDIQNSLLL